MQLLPHAQGHLVRYDDFKVSPSSKSPSELMNVLASFAPSLIVDRQGVFVQAEELVSLKDTIRKAAASFAANEMSALMRDLMTQMESDSFHHANAQGAWFHLVGQWIGIPPTGERFEQEFEEYLAIGPKVKIPMKLELRMISKAACLRGSGRYECAVFQMTSRPDPKAMESWVQQLATGAFPGAEKVKFERYGALTVLDVTLETGTMVPHEFSLVRTSEIAMQLPRMEITQSDRHSLKFNYDVVR